MAAELAPVVLLAGGAGSRVGRPKGLVDVGGEPWLVHQLAALEEVGARRVVVVLGAALGEYLTALPWLSASMERWRSRDALELVTLVNRAAHLGQFSSLQVGLRWLASEGRAAAFVLPIDVPCPAAGVWSALAAQLREGVLAAVPSHADAGGHPVLLSGELFGRLCALAPDAVDARLDVQLRAIEPHALRRVVVDDARVASNLNTIEAFARFARG